MQRSGIPVVWRLSKGKKMRILFLAAVFVPLVLSNPLLENPDGGKIWALLVAGSNDFWNYRHQADICHAYQIFHRHGISDENIVVMMYDDIAYNTENPDKGVIINQPNGTNVYKGVVKDYTGNDVTSKNFLNILQGNKKAMKGIGSGKVIESGPNDRVFVYFADHGGVGLICFPNDDLYVDDLTKALKSMLKKKSFNELLFYLEACEAGSMFEEFLKGQKNIKIVASTAANPDESSWGWYCENPLGTCLGDEYSISWMEHVDATDSKPAAAKETVMKQYQAVKKRVSLSHPQLYGGNHIKREKVHNFIGLNKKEDYDTADENSIEDSDETLDNKEVGVPSRDVALYTAQQQFKLAKTKQDKAKYAKIVQHLIKGRKLVDDTFEEIVSKVTANDVNMYTTLITKQRSLDTQIMPCYKNLIMQFKNHCFDSSKNNYVVGHYYKLANMCSSSSVNTQNVVSIFKSVCTDKQRSASGIH